MFALSCADDQDDERLDNVIKILQILLSKFCSFFNACLVFAQTIKKTSAVTQSVANTAKRVIVIVGVAIVLKAATIIINYYLLYLLLLLLSASPSSSRPLLFYSYCSDYNYALLSCRRASTPLLL